jgi:hypothetical protein
MPSFSSPSVTAQSANAREEIRDQPFGCHEYVDLFALAVVPVISLAGSRLRLPVRDPRGNATAPPDGG